MLGELSPARMHADVAALVGFGTRHTLSDTASATRGIGAARRFVQAQLEQAAASSGRSGDDAATVTLLTTRQPADGKRIPRDVDLVDVVATLPGASSGSPIARARRFVLVAHYDSRATDVNDATSDAPGANDNASGVAVLLEAFRVMARRRFDATLVFIATAGEEQGLFGARAAARAERLAGADVRAVLNDDIVGDPGGPRRGMVRLFSEGLPVAAWPDDVKGIRRLAAESDSPSRQVARAIAEIAAWQGTAVQPRLVFRSDRFLRGGDHTSFNEVGYPAVRFSVPDEHYDRQHQNVRVEGGAAYGDALSFIDDAYLAGVAEVNVAALAHLARAPESPADARIVVADLTNDVELRWAAGRDADLAGYEVLWRDTTSPVWQHARDVGRATQVRLAMNKDETFFAVRAYDAEGYRSVPSFVRAAER